MTPTATRSLMLLCVIAAFCVAAPAVAEDHEAPANPVIEAAESIVESMETTEDVANEGLVEAEPTGMATELQVGSPASYDGMTPEAAWADSRGWRYGTDYLFPLTRGGDEAGLPTWGRIVLSPITVALDTGMLPFGAVAGLFGD